MMGATSTARTRRCRQLAREGKIRLTVTLDLERLRDVLLSAGLLTEWDDGDRGVISAAFETAVELWMANEERKLGNP
jgi:hypothetical protein